MLNKIQLICERVARIGLSFCIRSIFRFGQYILRVLKNTSNAKKMHLMCQGLS